MALLLIRRLTRSIQRRPISSTLTGLFTPPNTGQFVFGFRTDQFDPQTGEDPGRILRDVQMAILPCAAPPALIDTITVTPGSIISVCPHAPVDFTVNASATTPNHVVSLTAVVKPAGALIVSTPPATTAAGSFTWTLTWGDVGIHIMVIKAQDITCVARQPLILESTVVYTIRVRSAMDAGPDKVKHSKEM